MFRTSPLAVLAALAIAGCAVDASGLPGRNPDDDAAVSDAATDLFVPDGPVTPDLGQDLGTTDLGPEPDMTTPIDMGPPDMGPPDMGPPDMGCGMPEACNGLDDDCDGAIDENPGGPRGENICPDCTRAVSPGDVTYQICPYAVSWTEARGICQLSAYELASPETMAEDTFLDGALISGGDYWIGLNRRGGGGWQWEDRPTNRPLGSFDDWRSDEPNGSGSCARIDFSDRQWRDSDCNGMFQDDHYFICEAP